MSIPEQIMSVIRVRSSSKSKHHIQYSIIYKYILYTRLTRLLDSLSTFRVGHRSVSSIPD